MKKLLKSIFITTASIGTISGSAAAVVSCGEDPTKDNQSKYNNSLQLLISKINTGGILSNFQIIHGGASSEQRMTELQTSIENKINEIIKNDSSMKDILGSASISIPTGAINTDNVGNDKPANNIKLLVQSDLEKVTLPSPSNISIKYNVINNAQDNYNQEVTRIVNDLNLNTETQNAFIYLTTSIDEIKIHIFDLINNEIGATNKYIPQFTLQTEIPNLENIATQMKTKIDAGAKDGLKETISGFIFKSKEGVSTGTQQSFVLNYESVLSKQEQYDEQITGLLDKFITNGSGTIAIPIVNNSTASDITNSIVSTIKTEISNNKRSYTVLDPADIQLTGVQSVFNLSPGDYSTPSNSLTNSITIQVGTTDDSQITPSFKSFHFFYIVKPSSTDSTNYSNTLKSIVSHFGQTTGTPSVPNNPITLTYNNATGTGWQTSVLDTIRQAIFTYSSSYSNILNLGNNGSNISITISGNNFVSSTFLTPKILSAQVSFTIPSKWSGNGDTGIPTANMIVLPIWYKVVASQSLLESAAQSIKDYFSNVDNKIEMKRKGVETVGGASQKTISGYIVDSINNYINHASGSGYLTNDQKAAVSNLTESSVRSISNINYDTTTALTQKATQLVIDIPKSAQSASNPIFTINDFSINYDVLANVNDLKAQSDLNTVISGFINDSIANPILLTHQESATDIQTELKRLILIKIQSLPNNIFFNNVNASNITFTNFNLGSDSPAKFDVTTLTADGQTRLLSGDTTKVNIQIVDNSYVQQPTSISLSSLHYSVLKNNQDKFSDQVGFLITGLQNQMEKTPFVLHTIMDSAAVRLQIINYINSYINTHTTEINLISTLFDNQLKTGSNSFNISKPTTNAQTSNAVTISLSSNDSNVSPLNDQPIVFKYIVGNGTTQTIYNQTMTKISNHFKNNPLFSIPGYSFLNASKINSLVQDSVYAYITDNSAADALTAEERTSLDVNFKTSISATLTGQIQIRSTGKVVMDSNNYISLSVPATYGATTTPDDLIGAFYMVDQSTDQASYNLKVQSLFSEVGLLIFHVGDNEDTIKNTIANNINTTFKYLSFYYTYVSNITNPLTSIKNISIGSAEGQFNTSQVNYNSMFGNISIKIPSNPNNKNITADFFDTSIQYKVISKSMATSYSDAVDSVNNSYSGAQIVTIWFLDDDTPKIERKIYTPNELASDLMKNNTYLNFLENVARPLYDTISLNKNLLGNINITITSAPDQMNFGTSFPGFWFTVVLTFTGLSGTEVGSISIRTYY